MRRTALTCTLSVLVAATSACTTAQVGTGPGVSVAPDSGQQCVNYCSEIGMDLAAVAIMASQVGCVCTPTNAEPDGDGAPAGEPAAAITSGMATIVMQARARQQREASSRQSSYRSSSSSLGY